MTAKRGTLPLPYVLGTDAGHTLELSSPPYLLPTAQEGKPFPAANAVRDAIASDNKAIATASGKSGRRTIYKVPLRPVLDLTFERTFAIIATAPLHHCKVVLRLGLGAGW